MQHAIIENEGGVRVALRKVETHVQQYN